MHALLAVTDYEARNNVLHRGVVAEPGISIKKRERVGFLSLACLGMNTAACARTIRRQVQEAKKETSTKM